MLRIVMKKVMIATSVALFAIATTPADAKTQQYPKKPGTNCIQKERDCENKCPGSNGSFTPTKVRNECLNNCVNSLDLCLGAPARAVDENGELIEESKPTGKSPKKKSN